MLTTRRWILPRLGAFTVLTAAGVGLTGNTRNPRNLEARASQVTPTISIGFSPNHPYYTQFRLEILRGVRDFFSHYRIPVGTSEIYLPGSAAEGRERFLGQQFDHLRNFGIYFESHADTDFRYRCMNEAKGWKQASEFLEKVEREGYSTPGDVTITPSDHARHILSILSGYDDEMEHGSGTNAGLAILQYRRSIGDTQAEIEDAAPNINRFFTVREGSSKVAGSVGEADAYLWTLPEPDMVFGSKEMGRVDSYNGRGFVDNFNLIQGLENSVVMQLRGTNVDLKGIDLITRFCILTACHEVGHLLGLPHSHYERDYDRSAKDPQLKFNGGADAFPAEVDGVPNVMRHGTTPLVITDRHPWGEALCDYQVECARDYLQQGPTFQLLRSNHFHHHSYIMSRPFREKISMGRLAEL